MEVQECNLFNFDEKFSELLENQICTCKALVPVAKLWIESEFKIGEFKFWPPVEEDEFSINSNPWLEYFVGHISNYIFQGKSLGQWDGDINKEEDLLRYPLIECTVEVYESDLLQMNNNLDARIRLIKKANEQAERALDLLRITHCHLNKIEYLPERAGQLANGFAVAYLIPELEQYKESLLKEIVRPIRVSNNWLGLEATYHSDPFIEWLAKILQGNTENQIEQAIKSSLIAYNQAFYTDFDEARFLALVFALDGLCSPAPNWKGWKHRTYIAAILSNGDIERYKGELKRFEYLYSDIRNHLVHKGSTFVDMKNENPIEVANAVQSMIIRCVKVLYLHQIKTIDELHSFASCLLSTPQFEQGTKEIIDFYDGQRGKRTPLNQIPKWNS
jgi:hypothetical protein